jgi:hypothetical protein
MVRYFKGKVEARVNHLRTLLEDSKGCPIQEIIQIIGLIRSSINENMNNNLEVEVSKEEVRSTLFYLKRGKCLGSDGLTVEFYVGFYDLIKG